MTEFPIEKNVPLPDLPGPGSPKYHWKSMEIGDSFFVPNRTAMEFGGHVGAARKSTGFGFTVKTREENGVRGVRVWRIA